MLFEQERGRWDDSLQGLTLDADDLVNVCGRKRPTTTRWKCNLPNGGSAEAMADAHLQLYRGM